MHVVSMARVHGSRLAFGACLAFVTAACGENDGDQGSHSESVDTSPACENRGEPILLGMSKQSDDGVLTATLLDVSPVPPRQGQNLWTVDLRTAEGPVLDALEPPDASDSPEDTDSTVIINIYMADHDHNLRKRGTMTSPGVFEFPPLTITMAGYWEFTVRVQPDVPADANDYEDVLFGFCVPKN